MVAGLIVATAIAVGLGLPDSFFTDAAATLRAKRDLLSAGLVAAGFTVSQPQGGYFVVADAAPLGHPDAASFARQLPGLVGVVAIPITAFVHDERKADYASLLRFAYCKKVDVLERAVAQLKAL